MDNRPIGIFDSGIGGLTVLNEVCKIVPNENIVYFGDCARTPYGNKSEKMVIKYGLQVTKFLMSLNVKMIVIACNTASAYCLNLIKKYCNLPIVEVIKPGALTGAKATKNKRIGIIGTRATISSGVYEKAVKSIDDSLSIVSRTCPLFVPLVEEGWWDNDIVDRVSEKYLVGLKNENIDTLILGCTHYPLLQDAIMKVMGKNIKCINSAYEVAKSVKNKLKNNDIEADINNIPYYLYYTSDSILKFKEFAQVILKSQTFNVGSIDIEKY